MRNAILKKLLAFVLSLTLVITMAPIIPGVASEAHAEEASKKTISEVNLTYDLNAIGYNVACTEGEVQDRIRDNIGVTTTGLKVDPSNSWLMVKYASGSYGGIGNGNNMIIENAYYFIQYRLIIPSEYKSSYDWVESVKKTSPEKPTGLTIRVNGEDVTNYEYTDVKYDDTYNELKVYIMIGTPSKDPIVKNITINESYMSVQKGTSHQFSGSVEGTVSDKSIVWSVEGASSTSTKITNGKLTVGADETADIITIKATANADTTKYTTLEVKVLDKAPVIESVRLVPDALTLYVGSSQKLSTEVIGTQVDKRLDWSIEGAASSDTTISTDGLLTIGSDETASTITVKATAVRDTQKVGTAIITVLQKNRINEVNLTCDLDNIDLSLGCTEGEVQSRIRNNISVSTEGVSVDVGNSWLVFKNEDNILNGVGDGTLEVEKHRNYYIKYGLDISSGCKDGYDWIESAKDGYGTGMTVYLNGTDITNEIAGFEYNEYANMLYILVSIGVPNPIDISNKEITLTPASFVYDGDEKYPVIAVKDGEKTLKENIDYTTEVSNNINAGTAIVLIRGINDYRGETSRPFTIAKQAYSSKFKTSLSTTKYTYNGEVKKPSVTVYNAAGKKLVNGTDYDVTYASGRKSVGRYKVTINFKGNYSGSKALYFTIVPKAPASAKASLTFYYGQTTGYDDVKFSWSKVTGASGYTVYYKKSTSSGYTYSTRTTGTSVRVKDLSDGAKYYFKVVPYYKSGDTRYVSLSSKITSVYTLKKLSAPTITKSSSKAVKVKWTNISGESGYEISRSTSKTGTYIVSTYGTTSGTYKTVSATKGKTYYYKVRAYKTITENDVTKKVYGKWSKAKAYTIK